MNTRRWERLSGAWRNAFLRMSYYREVLTSHGIIADTFETAVTWGGFDELYEGVRTDVQAEIKRSTGHDAVLSCHFTYVYPDGPVPYFSFMALGTTDGKLHNLRPQWRDIKQAANEAVVRYGGTATHHHAIGRDHRPAYERQSPGLYREALRAMKQTLDPNDILNSGVLLDPASRPIGIRGAMAP